MASAKKGQGDDPATSQPSETLKSIVSLLLVIHFFCVFVGITCVAPPFSPFQARLRYVLWPYTQLLSFDLESKPYYLTYYSDPGVEAEEFMDPNADFRVEVLPADKDPDDAANWLLLNDTGMRGGERQKRYQRLAKIMEVVSENKTAVSLLAQGVGNQFYTRHGELPQKIRVRQHLPQPRSWLNSTNKERFDPDGPPYFRTVVSFNVTGIMDGKVALSEEIDAAEAATTDAPGSSAPGRTGGSGSGRIDPEP